MNNKSRRDFLFTSAKALALTTTSIYTPNVFSMNFAAALKSGRRNVVWHWGFNSNYQLGTGSNTGFNSPTRLPSLSNIFIQFTCADAHTLALDKNGKLWAWGANGYGQLGDSSAVTKSLPVQIGNEIWTTVSAKAGASLGVRSDGTLWAWGQNQNGVLGTNTLSNYSSPVQIGLSTDWKNVTTNGTSSWGIKTDATLHSWGFNNYAQLGTGSNTPTQNLSPVTSFAGSWTQVTAGNTGFVLGIKTNGTLWTWGLNLNGQLGNGNATNASSCVQITGTWNKVAAGNKTSYGIKSDGTLWAWGFGGNGEIGNGANTATNSSLVQIGTETNWIDVSAGLEFCLALKNDGSVWAWGENANGQLGVGDATDRNSPVQVGAYNRWKGIFAGSKYAFMIQK